MSQPLENHVIADMYPMMQKNEFNNLLGSMEDEGYDKKQPIVLYNGQILDGRNRYKACQELKIRPIYRTFEGSVEEALEESRRLNSYRRHLENDQRAMCAAYEVMASREEDAPKTTVPFATMVHSVSSQRQVERAVSVLKKNPEIAENVFNGRTKIYQAEEDIAEIEQLLNPSAQVDVDTPNVQLENEWQIEQQRTTEQLVKVTSRLEELEEDNRQLELENRWLKENCGKKLE